MPLIELINADIVQQNQCILKNVNFNNKTLSLLWECCQIPDLLKEGSGEVVGYQLNNLKKSDVPFLRRKIGIIFQDFQLLVDRSIYENLFFVLEATGWKNKNEIKEQIIAVTKKVGMSNQLHKMPHELSGGEQQRICIARALLNNPKLILADEPTGNLDPETSDSILLLIKDLCQSGCAVLMATHEHNLIDRFPSKIIKCQNGQLTEG